MKINASEILNETLKNDVFSLNNASLSLLGVLDEASDSNLKVLTYQYDDQVIDLFNPIFSLIKANQVILDPKFIAPVHHKQYYDIDEDVLYRDSLYQIGDIEVKISSQRFMDHLENEIFIEFCFEANGEIELDLYHGFNQNIHGLDQQVSSISSQLHHLSIQTSNHLEMVILYDKDFRHKNKNKGNQSLEHYQIITEPGRVYKLHKYIGVGLENSDVTNRLKSKYNLGYDQLKDNHLSVKKALLKDTYVEVVNNDRLQTMLDYSLRKIYNQNSNWDVNHFSINQYFESYYFLHRDTKQLKQKLLSLFDQHEKIIENAQTLGYQGGLLISSKQAYGKGNYQLLSNAICVDIIYRYIDYTNDLSILSKGFEFVLNLISFFLDYATYEEKHKRFSINDVSNIDHSLNHVNNHTLTNYMVKTSIKQVKTMVRIIKNEMGKKDQAILKTYDRIEDKLNDFYQGIYIMRPNVDDLLFPYQNYQEDFEKERLFLENNRVVLTFDQLFIFNLYESKFSKGILTKNVEFYQKHAKLSLYNQFFLSIVGLEETIQDTYDYLMDSLSIYKDSLLHKEKLYGGVYYHLVNRMSRLRKDHHQFSVNTWIPKEVRRLEYPILYQEYTGNVKIKRNSAQINWSKEDES